MKYCTDCGSPLSLKQDGIDGEVPYCESCNKFHYPQYNVAVSAIIICNDKILLIKQYGKDRNILVAGYVTKGERVEDALLREIKEEVDLNVISYSFNESKFYEKSNTLIINFVVHTEGLLHMNYEVDDANWFSFTDAKEKIAPNSLAKYFLEQAFSKKMIF